MGNIGLMQHRNISARLYEVYKWCQKQPLSPFPFGRKAPNWNELGPFRESRHTKERKYWEKLEKNKYMEKQTYTFSHVYFKKTSNGNKHSQFYFLIFMKYSNENYYVLKCQTIKVLKYFL